MAKYIALLRAINVGGHTVKMDRLRGLFEELKFANVATFIASGNVIFESASKSPRALEKNIEAHLHSALGYEVVTFLRTPAELRAVAAAKPFPASELNAPGRNLYIGFVKEPLGAEAKHKLQSFTTGIDSFHTSSREVYWLCRTTSSQSEFSGGVFEKALRLPATFRNITTVTKLAALHM